MTPPSDFVLLVEGTGDPAFAVDAAHRIIAWNRAAERLLNVPTAEAVGRTCAEVLAGRDEQGRLVCGPLCPAVAATHLGEPLVPLELQVERRGLAPLWVAMSTLSSQDGHSYVLHLLRDVTEERARRSFIQHVLQGAVSLSSPQVDAPSELPPVVLSPRQTTILKLLAGGAGTRAIARALGISPATVRNHIQQIMVGLQAHSRLEAVVQALRRRIV